MNWGLQRNEQSLAAWWALLGFGLSIYFAAWWMHLGPGIFSNDSAYYLQQVLSGELNNQKPFLFTRFLQVTSFGGKAFQASMFVQVALVILVFSRALAIGVIEKCHLGWLILCGVLILNPYVANMAFYVQNDVLYSVAIIALLVETLYIARHKRVDAGSYIVFFVFSPMAFAFRDNGVLFLPPLLIILWLVCGRPAGIRLAAVAALSTILAYSSVIGVDKSKRHDLLYPAVIHEIGRLAQPGYRRELGSRLSPQTRDAVGMNNLAHASRVYWPLYWDTIGFSKGGPGLAGIPDSQRVAIVNSFLAHDLAPQLPSIIAHRVEMFLAAALARSVVVDPYAAPEKLPEPLRGWKSRQSVLSKGSGVLGWINKISLESRDWTWNALVGILLLAVSTCAAFWRRDWKWLAISGLLWLQAAVVFVVAPSAEYRYLFMLYLAPLLLLVGARSGSCMGDASATLPESGKRFPPSPESRS